MTRPNPHAGKSVVDILWEEMDSVMDRLMEDGKPELGSYDDDTSVLYWCEQFQSYGEERGQAQGLAYALAVLTNPYVVNVDDIRREAVVRWKERYDE